VKARRESDVVPFATPPQQSDYAALWAAGARPAETPNVPRAPSGLGALLPDAWKERLEDVRGAARQLRRPARDPRFFREVDLSRLAD
jgi:hypothetical protein